MNLQSFKVKLRRIKPLLNVDLKSLDAIIRTLKMISHSDEVHFSDLVRLFQKHRILSFTLLVGGALIAFALCAPTLTQTNIKQSLYLHNNVAPFNYDALLVLRQRFQNDPVLLTRAIQKSGVAMTYEELKQKISVKISSRGNFRITPELMSEHYQMDFYLFSSDRAHTQKVFDAWFSECSRHIRETTEKQIKEIEEMKIKLQDRKEILDKLGTQLYPGLTNPEFRSYALQSLVSVNEQLSDSISEWQATISKKEAFDPIALAILSTRVQDYEYFLGRLASYAPLASNALSDIETLESSINQWEKALILSEAAPAPQILISKKQQWIKTIVLSIATGLILAFLGVCTSELFRPSSTLLHA